MGVFSKREQIKRMEKRIEELEQENNEMKEVIRQLKDKHALQVDDLKDKLKAKDRKHLSELDEVRKDYQRWIDTHRGYSEKMRELNEQLMIKDIELNEIMNKIMR